MKLPVDQKIVCQIEERVIINILENINENDYDTNDYRNVVFPDVKSIPIFHSSTCAIPGNKLSDTEKKSGFEKFYPQIVPILDQLKKYYDYNYHTSFIANLKPGGRIHAHRDSGVILETCHRVHVPLKTNKDVVYSIAGKNYYWEMGNIYEFNNTLVHSVFNGSDQERLHLVLNLLNVSEEEMKTLNKI